MRPLVATNDDTVRVLSGLRYLTTAIDLNGQAQAVDVTTGEIVAVRVCDDGTFYVESREPRQHEYALPS